MLLYFFKTLLMKTVWFLWIVILFTLTSCSTIKAPESTNIKETTPNISQTNIDTPENITEVPVTKTEWVVWWVYQNYDISKLSDTKTNILFFAATWCPACQWADKNLSSENIPQNLNILKVDYDTYTDLKTKYEITMQHTFVQVDKDGNMIKKWSWSNNSADILAQIK